MLKNLFLSLILTGPLLLTGRAMAVSTGVELSSVDIPMEGATISLPGLEDIPIKQSPKCEEADENCIASDYDYYFETNNLIDSYDMGTAVIKTGEGTTYTTFTNQPFGAITLSDTVVKRNKVSRLIDPLQQEYKIKYDKAGRITSLTDSSKNTTKYAYDDAGNKISKTDPSGTETQYEYDSLGRRVAEVREGNRTTYEYSTGSDGNIIRTATRDAGKTTQYFDNFGRLISETGPTGVETSYSYDTAKRTIMKTGSDGTAVRAIYNTAGQKISELALNTDWNPYDPVEVGPKSKVGTESTGSKVAKAAAGKVLGSLFGGFGGGGKSKGPKTKKDPARRADKSELYDEATGTKLEIRPNWVDNKFHVSVNIKDSDDKGTFQYIYLVDQNGNMFGPDKVDLYKIWVKHTLTVSWTESTYVDGQLVSQTSGGWTESWIQNLGTFRVGDNPLSHIPGIWQMLGYDRAHAGARTVGATFNIDPVTYDRLGPLNLVVQVTKPKTDPVSTIPMIGHLFKKGDDDFEVEPIIMVTPTLVENDEDF